jgi:transcriptional regulator with XRE-family HTH domain
MHELREALGLTQEELARRAGLSQGSVSRFENGRSDGIAAIVVLRLTVALARACRGPNRHLMIETLAGPLAELAGQLGGQTISLAGTPWEARQAESKPARLLREARCWTVAHQGSVRALRDCAGLRHVAHLLRRPDQQVDALTLLASASGHGEEAKGPMSRAATERARLRVTRAIRRALARIAEVQPALGRHLDRTIKTGRRCSYQPAGDAPMTWEITETD